MPPRSPSRVPRLLPWSVSALHTTFAHRRVVGRTRTRTTARHAEHGIEPDEVTNVTDRILGKIGTNLHKEDKHPLNTIKKRIEQYFVNKYTTEDNKPLFNIYDSFKPVVSVKVRCSSPHHWPSLKAV